MAPIRLADLSSGIFAQEAHMPALKALADRFEVVAVYSRSQANANALTATTPHPVDIYDNMALLLARGDVDAMVIILPILASSSLVQAVIGAASLMRASIRPGIVRR